MLAPMALSNCPTDYCVHHQHDLNNLKYRRRPYCINFRLNAKGFKFYKIESMSYRDDCNDQKSLSNDLSIFEQSYYRK